MSVLKWLLKTAAVTALLFAAFVLPVLLWIYAPAYLALFFLFSACAAILFGAYIVSRAMPPEYKISWMFPALIAPFLGGALFLFFGNSRFGLKNDRSYTKKSLGLDAYLPAPAQGDGLFFEAAETIFCETGYPAARGDVSYYATGERFFDALLSAIEGAKHFVFLEFFIAKKGVLWDRLEKILLCKAKEQTEIRLVLDDMGCLGGIRRRDCEALERAGVRIHYFNPVFRLDGVNNRTHRKLAVIDGQEGFLCGANIADEYIKGYGKFGYWKDTGRFGKGRLRGKSHGHVPADLGDALRAGSVPRLFPGNASGVRRGPPVFGFARAVQRGGGASVSGARAEREKRGRLFHSLSFAGRQAAFRPVGRGQARHYGPRDPSGDPRQGRDLRAHKTERRTAYVVRRGSLYLYARF